MRQFKNRIAMCLLVIFVFNLIAPQTVQAINDKQVIKKTDIKLSDDESNSKESPTITKIQKEDNQLIIEWSGTKLSTEYEVKINNRIYTTNENIFRYPAFEELDGTTVAVREKDGTEYGLWSAEKEIQYDFEDKSILASAASVFNLKSTKSSVEFSYRIEAYGNYGGQKRWESEPEGYYLGPGDAPIEMFKIKADKELAGSKLKYQAFVYDPNTKAGSWQAVKNLGEVAGEEGKQITSIKMWLEGSSYNITYGVMTNTKESNALISKFVNNGEEVFNPNENKKPITQILFDILDDTPRLQMLTYGNIDNGGNQWTNRKMDSYFGPLVSPINKFVINISNKPEGMGLEYQVYLKEENKWQEWKSEGEKAGKDGCTITSIRIRLTGDTKGYNVKYTMSSSIAEGNLYNSPYGHNGVEPENSLGNTRPIAAINPELYYQVSISELDMSKDEIVVDRLYEIPEGKTFDIPKGKTIKFKKDIYNKVGFLVKGTLNLNGSSDRPITINSDIESNIKIEKTGTLRSRYTNVNFKNTKLSTEFIDNRGKLDIENGNFKGDKNNIFLDIKFNGDTSVKNSTISGWSTAIDISNTGTSNVTISNNNIINNVFGIGVGNSSYTGDNNSMDINNNNINQNMIGLFITTSGEEYISKKLKVNSNTFDGNTAYGMYLLETRLSNMEINKNIIKNTNINRESNDFFGKYDSTQGGPIYIGLNNSSANNSNGAEDTLRKINSTDENSNTLENNNFDGIVLKGSLKKSLTLYEGKYPYVIDRYIIIEKGTSLVLDAGCKVKPIGEISVYDGGNLTAKGTSDKPVIISAVKDSNCSISYKKKGNATDDSYFINIGEGGSFTAVNTKFYSDSYTGGKENVFRSAVIYSKGTLQLNKCYLDGLSSICGGITSDNSSFLISETNVTNTNAGFSLKGEGKLIKCKVYNNAGIGIGVLESKEEIMVSGCEIYDNQSTGIYTSGNLNVYNSTIRDNEKKYGAGAIGVSAGENGKLSMLNSTVSGNYITTSGNADVTINYCNILNGTNTGISNVGSKRVDARENYWGSQYGPYYKSDIMNRQYYGATVIGSVDVEPFYGEKISIDIGIDDSQISQDIYSMLNDYAYNLMKSMSSEGVNLGNGNYTKIFTDLAIDTPGQSINISRTYSSKNDKAGILGQGWTFSYDASLVDIKELYPNVSTEGKVATLPGGAVETFEKQEDGTFKASDNRDTLIFTDNKYTVTNRSGVGYVYNTNGKLESIISKSGNAISLSYSDNKLKEISDNTGRVYKLTYTGDRLVKIQETVNGLNRRKISYKYENDLLTSVTDVNGNIQEKFIYNNEKKISTIKRGNDDIEKIEYITSEGTTKGNISKLVDENGNTFNYNYDLVNKRVIVTDSIGNSTECIYDSNMYLTYTVDRDGYTTSTDYTVDSNENNLLGEEKSVKDKLGNITKFRRDSRGNIVVETLPDGSAKQYEYDEHNNVIKEVSATGNKKFYEYDESGKLLVKDIIPLNGTDEYNGENLENFAITTYEYYEPSEVNNIKGLVKKEIDGNGSSKIYTYDKHGNVLTETDANNNVTTYTYDKYGNKATEKNAKGYRHSFTYDNKGNNLSEVSPTGYITEKLYDKYDRLIGIINPKDEGNEDEEGDTILSERYTYYPSGKVKTAKDAVGNVVEYTYDVYGNKATEKVALGGMYRYSYDSFDRQIKTEYKDNNSDYRVIEENSYEVEDLHGMSYTIQTTKIYTDETNYTVKTQKVDYLGNVISSTNSDGTTTSNTYKGAGTVICNIDENGAPSYYYYNGFGKVSKTYDPQVKVGDNYKYICKEYLYDNNGKMLESRIGLNLVNKDEEIGEFYSQKYNLDAVGNVLAEVDSDGRKTAYEYDKNYNVIKKSEYYNNESAVVTTYEYDKNDKVVKESKIVDKGDVKGNVTSLDTKYKYDGNGNTILTTLPDGTKTETSYDSLNRKTSETVYAKDVNGEVQVIKESFSYVGDKEMLSSYVDGEGNKTTKTYSSDGKLIKESYSDGSLVEYTYDLAGKEISETIKDKFSVKKITKKYDAADRQILEEIQMQDGTSLVLSACKYDAAGNKIKEVDGQGYKEAAGNSVEEKIQNAIGREFAYDVEGNLVSVLSAENKKAGKEFTYKYEYNTLNHKTKEIDAENNSYIYKLDNSGNILEKSYVDSKGNKGALQKNTYDLLGNIISTTDANGNKTSHEINSLGQVKSSYIAGDESIEEESYTYKYDVLGNAVEVSSSNGTIINKTFNGVNNLLKVSTEGKDKTAKLEESYNYDLVGNLISRIDANGNVSKYKYDLRGNKIEETLNGELKASCEYNSANNIMYVYDRFNNKSENIYDAADRLIEQKNQLGITIKKLEYFDNGCQSKLTDALGNVTTYSYDSDGNLLSTIDPENKVVKNNYDDLGRLNEVIDGNGNQSKYNYDMFGNLTSVTNALGQVTTFTFDANGNETSMKDANGNVIKYEYNAGNKVSKVIAPNNGNIEGKVQQYTYNADGSIKNVKDRNGNVISYEYDAFGRKIKEQNGENVITYDYDNLGNVISVTDPNETTLYDYDDEGRTVNKEVVGKGKISYTYDIKSDKEHKEKITDSTGRVITKTYDGANKLVNVQANDDSIDYSYYDNGALKEIKLPDNSIESYKFNKNNTVDEILHINSDGTVKNSYKYEYDKNNNIISSNENGNKRLFTYDKLSRIQDETYVDGTKKSYTYNLAGNRATETEVKNNKTSVKNFVYDNENRLIESISTVDNVDVQTTYSYDNNGNLLKEQSVDTSTLKIEKSRSLVYDNYNNLIEVSEDGKVLEKNKYNFNGLRIEKETDKNVTKYLYDGNDILLELDKDSNVSAENVYGLKLLSRTVNNETGYYKYNGHGDVTDIVNNNGKMLASYTYDSFGNIVAQQGKFNNPYRYSGYVYDEEVNYYYLQSRMYDPELGRFLQEDTFKGNNNDPLSLNRYTYCHNNPLIYDDPNGHWINLAIGAVINVGITAYKDYKDDGKINAGWKTYAKSAVVGAITSVSGIAGLAINTAIDTYSSYKSGNKVTVKSVVKTAAYNAITDWAGGKAIQIASKAVKTVAKKVAPVIPKIGAKISQSSIVGKITSSPLINNAKDKINSIVNKMPTSLNRNVNTSVGKTQLALPQPSNPVALLPAGKQTTALLPAGKQSTALLPAGNKPVALLPEGKPKIGCFIAGTLIKAIDGNKEIQDIQVGDKVFSKNVDTEETGYKEVKKVFVNDKDILVHLEVEDTKIDTTVEHPFWVEGREWILAGFLNVGDVVTLANGEKAEIANITIEKLAEPVKVYNFEVSDWHTYHVADAGVLVHNTCADNSLSNAKGVGKASQGNSTGSRAYQSTGRMSDDLLLNPKTNTRGTNNLTEWRRSISKSDIKSERIKFIGEDSVKVDKGVWRSLDGTRQFRVVESDYFGRHGIGSPLVPNTPHVHFEFLGMPNAGGNKLKVLKNVHVPLK